MSLTDEKRSDIVLWWYNSSAFWKLCLLTDMLVQNQTSISMWSHLSHRYPIENHCNNIGNKSPFYRLHVLLSISVLIHWRNRLQVFIIFIFVILKYWPTSWVTAIISPQHCCLGAIKISQRSNKFKRNNPTSRLLVIHLIVYWIATSVTRLMPKLSIVGLLDETVNVVQPLLL